MRSLLAILLLLCAGVGNVAARENVQADMDLPKIREEQTALRARMQAGEDPFSAWPAGKRQAVLQRQDRVLRLIDGKQSVEEISEDQRNGLFNDLEGIQAALAGTERERMICKRVRRIGSHRMETICRSAAQQAESEAEHARTVDRARDCSQADNGAGLGCSGM